MPRIDPYQLLTCLSVLLSREGGILSRDEVPRLVNLMTKFSKKLVSKCVYVLILKSTEQSLVNMFMAEGGWALIHTWLQDAIHISNWDLVTEILTLLLVTPVDVERLKLNNIPKLVKSLSRLEENKGVQELSSQLVHDWLAIVKSNTNKEVPQQAIETINSNNTVDVNNIQAEEPIVVQNIDTVDSSEIDVTKNEIDTEKDGISTTSFYTVTVRDGKPVISRTAGPETEDSEDLKKMVVKAEESEEKDKKSKSRSSSSKHSSSSSSSSNKSKSSSSTSKDKDKHRSSSSKSSSRDKEKEKDKDRRDKDKYKHKSNGSKHSSGSSNSSTSSSSSKDKTESKEKQAEKDKDTLAKIKPQSIDKLGRIPKKTDDSKVKEVKKPTMSIEVRKNNEERPKTVKVFNSKRRTTGLEDEAKPAPPRPVKKPTTTPPVVPPIIKRPSPTREPSSAAPPEKKLKVELPPERPGAIKLIPPKPKPPVLQESDIFMDALTASATAKKEPKKRKRRASVSKDTPTSPTQQTEQAVPQVTSPLGLKNIAAPNFYQDTLNTEEQEEKDDEDNNRIDNGRNTPTENQEIEEKKPNADGLRSALILTKRKGPKKSVRFNDTDLTQVKYFELDETERVNVTKTFMDMAKMDISSEREALQLSRKLANEDVMEVQTMWRLPYLIDLPESLAVPGCKSLEKDIQFAREKSVLQALYFDKRKIPDSAEEPVPENYQVSDPITIPLDDAESQEIDLRNTPWPEPKGSPPPPVQETNIPPQLYTNVQMPFQNFPHNGPPQPFPMPPRFPMGPNGPQPGPGMFGPPNLMQNGNLMGPPNMGPPQDMMHQGPLNPNAFGPGPGGPDNFNPMMGDNNFPMPFNQPNMGMFPPNNFNMNRGGGRGGFRRGGGNNGPWIRMNGPGPGPGPGNWNRGPPNNRGGRLCKNVKNHGFCRNMDKCPFIHPK